MKMTQKLTALLLVALMFVSIITSMTLTANAATVLQWPVPGHFALSRGYSSSHGAMDINDSSIKGANIVAAMGGTIVRISKCTVQHYGEDCSCGGTGTGVVVKGTDNRYYSYAHMLAGSIPSSFVVNKTKVNAGDILGRVGTTGNSSGPHLHFSIATGSDFLDNRINPEYETYTNVGATPFTFSTYSDKLSVSNNDAVIAIKISKPANNRLVSYGATVYDINGVVLGKTSANSSGQKGNSTVGLWWTVSSDMGITLEPGRTYQFTFWANVSGVTLTSSKYSFKTTGTNVSTYTISYNANGGSGAPAAQTKIADTTLTLSGVKPTREGYTFLGWSTSSTATGATYQPGGSFTANASTTLYAVWKQGCENGTHSYSYTATNAPTASATGTLTGTCSKCSGTTTVTLPKLNTIDYVYEVTKEATCAVTGTGRYTWNTTTYGSFCFDVTIAETGHAYTSKVTAPTYNAQGYTTYTCSKCGDSYVADYTDPLDPAPVFAITQQPQSVTAKLGETVTFAVVAQGEGLTYQWKYKNATATGFTNTALAGNKTDTLTVSNLTNGHHGRQYLCVITDAQGNTVETVAVTLQVAYLVTNAKNQTAEDGENATFSVQFSMTEGVSYQWQYKGNTASSTWANTSMTGAKTDTLTVGAIPTRSGYQYRCKITVDGIADPIYSREVTLTVTEKPSVITSQPASLTAKTGATVTFTVGTQGTGLTYKWQYSNDGAAWMNTSLSGYNTATLTVSNVGTGHHGRQYRCIVTDADGEAVYSEPATLSIPYVVNQPKTTWAGVNTNTKFTVNYSVSEGVTYQWQYKGNTSASTWANTSMTGAKTNTLTVGSIPTRNGYSYRCVINDNGTEIVTNAAILYVQAPAAEITKQPAAASAVSGNTVQFSITATGEGLTYQWQWSDDGENWSDTRGAGYATPTLTVKTNNYNGGRLYRCCVKTVNGSAYNKVYSDPAQMTVLPAAEVTQQPQSITVKAGESATFHVEAEGEGLTYQWQWAKFVGNWKNTSYSGYNTDTLTIPNVTKEMNGRYYRVIITNKYSGTVTTEYVRLTVQ